MRNHGITWAAAAVWLLVAGLGLGALVTEAAADPFTIRDNGSWARIWTDSDLGMDIWVVNQPDGTDLNVLTQQWFWYRTGTMASERSLDEIGHGSRLWVLSDTDGDGINDNLRLRYNLSNEGLTVDVNYNLMGGTPGSGRADMAETIRITNQDNLAQQVHLFQYSDFNLSADEDWTAIRWPNTADVWFSDIRMSETVVTPVPTAHAVGLAPDLLASLNDGLPTVLDGSTGPIYGDTAWVFEWDMMLDPGGTVLISKDKSITPTPEPATLALLGLGALGLVARRRRT